MSSVQLPLFVPLPQNRKPGWISYGDRVVIVEVDKKEQVRIRTGFICSDQNSHVGIDNVKDTIVWGDCMFNDMADNADDAYERSFKVNDPNLIKMEEVQCLKDPGRAVMWFADKYSPDVAVRIARALTVANLEKQRSSMFKNK